MAVFIITATPISGTTNFPLVGVVYPPTFSPTQEGKMSPRKSNTRRKKTPDLRRLAQAAHADAASIATSLNLLLATEKETVIDADTNALITSGIQAKCLSCCAVLQNIATALGGAQ
jgi:hypothetical protein